MHFVSNRYGETHFVIFLELLERVQIRAGFSGLSRLSLRRNRQAEWRKEPEMSLF